MNEHASTLSTMVNLASSLWHQGKHDEAEKMERKVLAVMQRVLGAEHPITLTKLRISKHLILQRRHARLIRKRCCMLTCDLHVDM